MFEVSNQPPPLEPYNLFASDGVLREASWDEAVGLARIAAVGRRGVARDSRTARAAAVDPLGARDLFLAPRRHDFQERALRRERGQHVVVANVVRGADGRPVDLHRHPVEHQHPGAVQHELVLARGAPGEYVLEPVVEQLPSIEWLTRARELCDAHGAVLIFDEIKTGFRVAPGGYSEVCGVQPDLASYGKAMANGYPLGNYAKTGWFWGIGDHRLFGHIPYDALVLLVFALASGYMLRRTTTGLHVYAMGSDRRVTLGDRAYTPTEVSAIILRTLKQQLETVELPLY